ncbi:MAG TPA: ABC transporter permease [Acidimicrobiia bacterium]|nr:ABC transporter permease [Acidimicrobiia bacterium]
MSSVLTTRVLPPIRRPGSRAHRLVERNFMVYRRIWLIIVSGFFEPVFYLLSVGIGVGVLVGNVTLTNGEVVTYTAFVAPALLASSAMNGAVFESTLNVFFKLKWGKVYDAVLTTPLQPLDIALGETTFSLIRGGVYSLAFVIVMVFFGLVNSWWALAAIPACLLIGFAFAGVGMAATTFMKSWQDFDLVQLVVQPLFLFSGTFFPIDVYPPALQTIARFSPLYHGTELVRAATLASFDWSVIGHIAFLAVMGSAGMAITQRRFAKLLLP